MLRNLKFKNLFLFSLALVILAGAGFQVSYSMRGGASGCVPEDLRHLMSFMPTIESGADYESSNLILFFHPKCPCTRATLANLHGLKNRLPESIRFTAFCFHPAGESKGWLEQSHADQVRSLGANVVSDAGGAISRKFGVLTSGHILFYDRAHRLVFNGGVTMSRGHAGECSGLLQLLDCIDGKCAEMSVWPVFGCPISEQGERQL